MQKTLHDKAVCMLAEQVIYILIQSGDSGDVIIDTMEKVTKVMKALKKKGEL